MKRILMSTSIQRYRCRYKCRSKFAAYLALLVLCLFSEFNSRKRLSHASSQAIHSGHFEKEAILLFIAVNVNYGDYPLWLRECTRPRCAYQVFGDHPRAEMVTYSADIGDGYGNFGFRGRFQMMWALEHANFTYFLRVDEDGYLCVNSLFQDLQAMPQKKFLMGRFHCDFAKARMDENFMLFSRDVAEYFSRGWQEGTLPFHGEATLALNIGSQLSRLMEENSWTFRDEPTRIRWDETFRTVDVCTRYFWLHHLSSTQIREIHSMLPELDAHMQGSSKREERSKLFFNSTGCGWDGLPEFHDLERVAYSRGKRGPTLYHDFRPV